MLLDGDRGCILRQDVRCGRHHEAQIAHSRDELASVKAEGARHVQFDRTASLIPRTGDTRLRPGRGPFSLPATGRDDRAFPQKNLVNI